MGEYYINHDLRVYDGKTIFMPPWAGGQEGWGNLALPDVLVWDTAQKYPVGTKLVDGDRVFRYCKAGSGITAMKAGHQGAKPSEFNTEAVIHAAGATKITILDTGSASNRPVNYYAGGYLWIMDLISGIYMMHRILSSTVGNTVSITLTLETGLKSAVALAEVGKGVWITAWPNIYSKILGTTSTKMSNVVVALIPVTSGKWFWGQTWGPCFGTSFNVVPGLNANQREVYFNSDGALMAGDDLSLDTTVRQRAGFILTNTTDGGDQLYMLQLSP